MVDVAAGKSVAGIHVMLVMVVVVACNAHVHVIVVHEGGVVWVHAVHAVHAVGIIAVEAQRLRVAVVVTLILVLVLEVGLGLGLGLVTWDHGMVVGVESKHGRGEKSGVAFFFLFLV